MMMKLNAKKSKIFILFEQLNKLQDLINLCFVLLIF